MPAGRHLFISFLRTKIQISQTKNRSNKKIALKKTNRTNIIATNFVSEQLKKRPDTTNSCQDSYEILLLISISGLSEENKQLLSPTFAHYESNNNTVNRLDEYLKLKTLTDKITSHSIVRILLPRH